LIPQSIHRERPSTIKRRRIMQKQICGNSSPAVRRFFRFIGRRSTGKNARFNKYQTFFGDFINALYGVQQKIVMESWMANGILFFRCIAQEWLRGVFTNIDNRNRKQPKHVRIQCQILRPARIHVEAKRKISPAGGRFGNLDMHIKIQPWKVKENPFFFQRMLVFSFHTGRAEGKFTDLPLRKFIRLFVKNDRNSFQATFEMVKQQGGMIIIIQIIDKKA